MKLDWAIKVKFRIWGITIGQVDKSGTETISLPIPVPIPFAWERVVYNDRGVWLHVRVYQ